MNRAKRCIFSSLFCLAISLAGSAQAATSKIGILVFDGFLTSDVTAPVEVFGAATKKAWFSSYQVVIISVSKSKTVHSEEGLKIIADKTIYDDIKLDVLIVPSANEISELIQFDRLASAFKP